ncbi:MAG: urea transporter [Bacteroidales bacterium]
MTKIKTENILPFFKGVLASYSQVFFSRNKLFGILLFLVTFIHPYAGMAGLLAVITSLATAWLIGYDKKLTEQGIYGFNSLLTALCMGIFFEPSPLLLLLIAITSVFVVFLTVAMQGILYKYNLPFLSIPFLISVWIVILATRNFNALSLSPRTIFFLNELYKLGGNQLVRLYEMSDKIPIPGSIKIYLESLGAIFFQYNLLAGAIIAIGLFFFSRIAFSLSLVGFYSAWIFYKLIGADISSLGYSYIGFNYILTAIAIGGYFFIPSFYTYLWVIIVTPMVAFVSLGFQNIFNLFQLPVYSLPFNFLVLLYLYAFRLRSNRSQRMVETIIQRHTPEENLYSTRVSNERFRYAHLVPIKLPFWGEWTVMQGYNGEYTHQDDWRFAWDFIIVDSHKMQYSGEGVKPEDYYCFGKPVIAPADGEIAVIEKDVDDNPIGKVNMVKNWGNTVVIKHSPYLYSQLSHLKKGSIKVKPGDQVKAGQVLGVCGNSGRSPYPHLHFQLQSTPFIGSKTIQYPISHYLLTKENGKFLQQFQFPSEKDTVSNLTVHPLLKKSFDLVPGQKIKVTFLLNGKETSATWEVATNIYNESYLYCPRYKSAAYFINDGVFFRFVHFEGNRKSMLYYFYLAYYEIVMSTDADKGIESEIPAFQVFKPHELIVQDILAPFLQFIHARYMLRNQTDYTLLTSDEIGLFSEVTKIYAFRAKKRLKFESTISQEGFGKIKIYEE